MQRFHLSEKQTRGHEDGSRQPGEQRCAARWGLQPLQAAGLLRRDGRIRHPDPAKTTGRSCSESIKMHSKHQPKLHWFQNMQGLTPRFWQARCWMMQSMAGNLTPTTLLVCVFLYFVVFPTEMGGWAPFLPPAIWHQHLHAHVAVTLLPLVSSEWTNGKTSLLNLPGHHWGHLWWVRRDSLSVRDWGGTNSVKQGLPISPLWGASTPFVKTLMPVLSLNTIRTIMVVFILWSMRFNPPIIPLTKLFV